MSDFSLSFSQFETRQKIIASEASFFLFQISLDYFILNQFFEFWISSNQSILFKIQEYVVIWRIISSMKNLVKSKCFVQNSEYVRCHLTNYFPNENLVKSKYFVKNSEYVPIWRPFPRSLFF